MFLQNIKLKNIRNYDTIEVDLSEGLNIFIGNNAQGKTNFLESIYICAIGRSYKSYKDIDIINWNSQEASIQAILNKKNREEKIKIYFNKNKKKQIYINDIIANKISKLIGILNVVIFTPQDMIFFTEGPTLRRQYFDAQISQTDMLYFENIQNYNRVIKQKNNALKERNVSHETLDIWNEQLMMFGKKIIDKRKKYIEEIEEKMKKIHSSLTLNKEKIEVFYEPNTTTEDFENNLIKKEDEERKYMCSQVGPHRDDISFKINGYDVKGFCSQGQQRTAILSLKFSEIELMREKTGEMPILLLDDVLSELDNERKHHLMKYTRQVQTIITTTEIDENIKDVLKYSKVFYVENGNVKE